MLNVLLGPVLMLGVFPALGTSASADYDVSYVYRWRDEGSRQLREETRTADCSPWFGEELSGRYVVLGGFTVEDRTWTVSLLSACSETAFPQLEMLSISSCLVPSENGGWLDMPLL